MTTPRLGVLTARRPFLLLASVGALVLSSGCSSEPQGEEADDVTSGSDAVAVGREIFVSGRGSDGPSADGSREKPFRTIQKAADRTLPGDTVSVLDGTYTNAWPTGAVVDITRSGTENAWIRYRAYPGHKPKLKFNGWHGFLVHKGASYVEIRGFELEGGLKDVTLEYCKTQKEINNPLCNTNGISVDGRDDGAKKPHHLRIWQNTVHDCPGGGIAAIAADYVTIDQNRIRDTSWYARFATSGISILIPWSFDKGTGYKMFVRSNRLTNNKSLVEWEKTKALSDGNGIIIDSYNADINENGQYVGRTLVANNIVVKNGGSGIHSYRSSHVDIVNNTAYMNGQVVDYEEIFAQRSSDVRIINNIMYARPDGRVNGNDRNADVTYDYNLYFSKANPAVVGPHDILGDPLFADAAVEGWEDFRLKPGSPAIDRGTSTLAPTQDYWYAPRPQGNGTDLGAYEMPSGG